MRREQDGLAEVGELADDVPGRAAGRGVEARRGLVEEDQLGVADEREREVEPARLAARQRADVRVLLVLEPGERDDLLDVARVRVEAGPVASRPRATVMWRYMPEHCRTMPTRSRSARGRCCGSWPSTDTIPLVRVR